MQTLISEKGHMPWRDENFPTCPAGATTTCPTGADAEEDFPLICAGATNERTLKLCSRRVTADSWSEFCGSVMESDAECLFGI